MGMETKEKMDLIQNSVDLKISRNFTYHYEILQEPSDTQLTHLFNTLSRMDMPAVKKLHAALQIPDGWPKDYWDAYEGYSVDLRGNRLTGEYGFDEITSFSLPAEKARTFVANYLKGRLSDFSRQHPNYAAQEAAKVRKLQKQWRQIQRSGKMWPMP